VAFVLTSIRHWLLDPEHNVALVLVPLGLVSMLVGATLLMATAAIYIFGRNRIRTASQDLSSAPGQG
jgi:hypothetical protein